MRRFGGDRIKNLWSGLMGEDTPIENKLVNRSIEGAQVKVEGYHFDLRKHLVEYDDVVNTQRELIYSERGKIIGGADLKANILSMIKEELQRIVAAHISDGHGVNQNLEGLINDVTTIFPLPSELNITTLSQLKSKQIEDKLIELAESLYEEREKELGADEMRVLERVLMLRTIDNLWIEHLTSMEDMRREAGWQTLRQVKAIDAYKSRGYEQFQVLLDTIRHDVAHTIFHVNVVRRGVPVPAAQAVAGRGAVAAEAGSSGSSQTQRTRVGGKKIGRNEPCPCGSGKKYKHCCGR